MFDCDQWKNVSACDRRKPDGCKPKNDFDRDFFCGATMYNVHIEVASLVYIYVYVGSKRFFSPVFSKNPAK